MSKCIGPRFYSALLILGLIPIALLNAQQSATDAPVPPQIAAAKKVFVSNGGSDTGVRRFADRFSDMYTGGPDRTYNQFYGAMKGWGHYELVTAPADADLVFEITFRSDFHAQGSRFRLRIIDPKTRTVLWSVSELVEPFARKSTGNKNYDRALGYLITDLKDLVARAG